MIERSILLTDLLDKAPFVHTTLGNKSAVVIAKVNTISEGVQGTLVFIADGRSDRDELIAKSKASAIVCDYKGTGEEFDLSNKCLILTSQPRLFFARVVNHFFVENPKPAIHPMAIIHANASIGKNCHIGPNTYVGDATIGDNCIIYGNCFIYDGSMLGNHVVVHANSVIGSDGFGYLKNVDGTLINFPHIGNVIIEDFVEIGSNTSIDKGSLGHTIIKQGAKIDNLVHIAHNVVIGRNCFIIAHAMIGGSTVIGDNTWVAPSASIRDRLVIGSNCVVGMGSVVTKSVPDHQVWTGNPAKPLDEIRKIQSIISGLIKKTL